MRWESGCKKRSSYSVAILLRLATERFADTVPASRSASGARVGCKGGLVGDPKPVATYFASVAPACVYFGRQALKDPAGALSYAMRLQNEGKGDANEEKIIYCQEVCDPLPEAQATSRRA